MDTEIRYIIYASSLGAAEKYASHRRWNKRVWLFVTDDKAPVLPRVYVRDFKNEWDLA